MNWPSPQSILITGASSGIGEALARLYAAKGIDLHLGGRDAQRLRTVADDCRRQGAVVNEAVVNVRDRAAMAAWIAAADDARPIDLLIANAGVARSGTGEGDEEERVREIFAVNLDGVLNSVLPILPRLQRRRAGQIAIVSSIAGYRGVPGTPAYAASKAAVKAWGEGLRGRHAADGIRVSVVCPGFVVSRMTARNRHSMPFLMGADKAAAIIRRGLERNRPRIAFPWPMAFGAWLGAALPPGVSDWLMTRLPFKE
jgi:NADP-dependent 3-hydroxy acid dehydrogenase YdfG